MITRILACGLNNIHSRRTFRKKLDKQGPTNNTVQRTTVVYLPIPSTLFTLALHPRHPHQYTTHLTYAGRLPTLPPDPRQHTVHTTHASTYGALLLKLKRKAAAKLQKRRLLSLLSLVYDFIDSSVLQVFLSITSSENN